MLCYCLAQNNLTVLISKGSFITSLHKETEKMVENWIFNRFVRFSLSGCVSSRKEKCNMQQEETVFFGHINWSYLIVTLAEPPNKRDQLIKGRGKGGEEESTDTTSWNFNTSLLLETPILYESKPIQHGDWEICMKN